MIAPAWLGTDGRTLVVAHDDLSPLQALLDVLAPGAAGPVPVAVHAVDGTPGTAQTFHGSGPLWGEDDCRFQIRTATTGGPVAMAAYKPMVLSAILPGLEHSSFWMITEADTEADNGTVTLPDGTELTILRRHLIGEVVIGGTTRFLRLHTQADDLIAEFDLAGDLSGVERSALAVDSPGSGSSSTPAAPAPLDLLHIAPLLGTDHDPHSDLRWLPDPLREPDLLTLDRLGFTISPNGSEHLLDVSATFGVAESGRWTIVGGFSDLTVGDITVMLGVRHPLDGRRRRPDVALSGTITIGDATLRIGTRWPDLAVTGELVDGSDHPLTVSRLLGLVHLPPLEGGPQLESLTIAARPTGANRSLSLRASAADVFSIGIGGSNIELHRLDLALDLARTPPPDESTEPSADRSLDAAIGATLLIGGVSLLVDAATVHDSAGWQLSARLGAEPIHVGALETWIGDRFGDHTFPANLIADDLDITDLEFSYHTATGDSAFRIVTDFELSGSATAGELELDFQLSHHGADHYERRIEGRFSLGEYAFDLVDATDSGGESTDTEMLTGTFRHEGPTTVGQLLAAAGVPFPIDVDLTDAVIGHSADSTLCLIDMASGFDLAKLPLVGPLLTGETTLSFALRVMATSGPWDTDLVTLFNGQLDPEIDSVPVPERSQPLPEGAALLASITIAGETKHLPDLGVDLSPSAKTRGSTQPQTTSRTTTAASGTAVPVEPKAGVDAGVTWAPIQRSLGPLHARRLGVHVDTAAARPSIELLLDADVTLGGFTLSLEGLGVESPLDEIAPSFSLRGLGLDVSSDAYQIGGVFLRTGPEEFAGAATVRTGDFALSAIGAYGKAAGHPSVFLYAVLDYPIGGPSFFFVTGLAAGFGYNRRLIMPGPDAIAEFPLVADAVAGAGNAELPSADGISAKLAALEQYIPPSYGDLFFAIGVKFNSFKLIDSFVLAAVSISSDVRIDVLGLSTMVLPSQEGPSAGDPLAEIQVALHAQILPTRGFVGVDARLTSASYVLSRDCHLRGGAAFYAWFGGDEAGDFVATLGGYHPHFQRPAHYPDVPRLSFDWHVTGHLTVKGAMYCALTPSALMAGGSFEASYVDGALHAWFRTGADFLLSWQPYHYDASMYISVGARWHFIHGEFGASLHVWGPDFAGNAEVDLGISSFTVNFGHRTSAATTVQWSQLQKSSLPPTPVICGVVCQKGLLRQINDDPDLSAEWVVSANELSLEITSQIPATTLTFNDGSTTEDVEAETVEADGQGHPTLGAGPVGINQGQLTSTVDISVRRVEDQTLGDHVGLRTTVVTKSVPAALWGNHNPRPSPNDPRIIENALVGYRLRPERHDRISEVGPFDRNDHHWNEHDRRASRPFWVTTNLVVTGNDPTPAEESARARAELLTGLGIDPGGIRPGADVTAALLTAPNIGRFTVAPDSA